MDFSALIIKMFIFVLLMLVGYFGARRGTFTVEFAKGLSKLVIDVFLTCSIINSVICERPDISGAELWRTMLILSLTIVLCFALAALVSRVFRIGGENAPLFELLMSVMNNIFIGLPVLQEVYGASGALYCTLSCIPFNLILYTYGVIRLKKGKEQGKIRLRLKDMTLAPLIASLAALLIFITDISLPRLVTEFISTGAAATMPVSMIVIGATLGRVSLFDAFREKSAWLLSLVRLVICPLLIWLVIGFVTSDAVLLGSCVILSACPSAVIVTALALQYGYDAAFSSKGVLVTTVLSMATLPLFAYLLA